jgi:GNAT superfamily N-acetyltransferase
MRIEVSRVAVDEITSLRELYRHEMNGQIIHDSFARRGFSDCYLTRVDGRVAGYALVANTHDEDTVHEFYLAPAFRADALPVFRRLLDASGAMKVMAQTNDPLMLLMLFDCATNITKGAVIFADAMTTRLPCPAGELCRVTDVDRDRLAAHKLDTDAEWMVEVSGEPVATGGALYHYNPPYGDIYMAVAEPHRRRGFGSYLVQELKRICYESGKIPAARCNPNNTASRRTLERAGLLPCGHIVSGDVVR